MTPRHLVVAMTGASGAIYGIRLCRELLQRDVRLSLLVSRAGFQVVKEETGLDWQGDEERCNQLLRQYFATTAERLTYYDEHNLFVPIASGSAAAEAMVVAPCSMGSVARIAAGISGTLLERVADVMLKEQRPLLLVPRETPLNQIHLENLLRLARAGARIVPAMPAFYHHPTTMDELVAFMVGKILDQLGFDQQLFPRWGG